MKQHATQEQTSDPRRLLSTVRPLLIQAARQEVETMLAEAKRAIEQKLEAHIQEMKGGPLAQIESLKQMGNTLLEFLDKHAES